MNTKDFVVLPWGKPGNSVKLKYKNAQELRMEKVRLELENQEMAKKLEEFRSTMNKQKEERESSGYHWKSGKVGKLGNQSHMMSQNRRNFIKLSAGKVKLKLLKEQIQGPVKQPVNYKMANSFESEKPKIKGKVCGQCENKAALLVCLECGEDYCSGCFAKIHQKGALRLHRTTLLQAKSQILSSVLDIAHQFIKEVNPDEPKRENNSTKETSKSQHKPKSPLLQGSSSEVEITTTKKAKCTKPRDRLLGEGSFDEEASAQSFQEALSQWRTGNHDDNEKQNLHEAKPDPLEECEVQTDLKIWREPLNIEFKENSLCYMEKLWLKKHRRTPQEQLLNMLPDTFIHPCKITNEAQRSQNENDEDSDGEEINVQHPDPFLTVEELNIERPEPSLKIVELDDMYEEEFEEPRNIVPYKVELADADVQQSFLEVGVPAALSLPPTAAILSSGGFPRALSLSLGLLGKRTETSSADFDNTVDPDVYSSDIEKIEESSIFGRNLKEKRSSQWSVVLSTSLLQVFIFIFSYHFSISKDREWIPDHSISALADNAVVWGILQSAQNPSSNGKQPKTVQKSQRPSTANLPLSNSVKKSSSCLSSSHLRSRSAAARSLSTAASEISEIEYIDITDQYELFLDDTADQQTLDSLEKELNVLRNLSDPSEKIYSLTSGELPAFNNHSGNISQTPTDFLNTSRERGPCGAEELSSSGRDTEIQSLLSLSESSTDEEEEFLDKQHVITLPWSKST
ncbi:PREDICTED: zinc finger B-box domain-containing protein 1 [Propithecus coquereli]|uniref:zinc finger B-box domain-containing protein 1 n=1 Tax=Propithecus coquereli TaxID=379532 RepID=UPI00063F32E9|nr:PREDICTED: zinc finger B-box domain-containing protein 1 [Propithecus coquereli]